MHMYMYMYVDYIVSIYNLKNISMNGLFFYVYHMSLQSLKGSTGLNRGS